MRRYERRKRKEGRKGGGLAKIHEGEMVEEIPMNEDHISNSVGVTVSTLTWRKD